jgi:dTDP-4-dehydrorhamnose 3,5-epimerase
MIIDLRPESPTFKESIGVELTPENGRMVYVPEGFAHGFQTLKDDTAVLYLLSEYYAPHAADGVRHDDPAFGLEWPLDVTVMSEKDQNWPDFQ